MYEWCYLLIFFWVLTGKDFAGGTVNEQEETHKSTIFDYTFTNHKEKNVAEKHIDFKVNYRKLRIFEECNTSEIKFPMVLSAPHCGQFFPEEFLNAVKMDINELRSNEDSFVDELVRPA